MQQSGASRIDNGRVSSFDMYCKSIRKNPILARGEEERISRLLVETGDQKYATTLVEANLRFVMKVAIEYQSYGFPLEDLIQEGNVGLLKAVERFNPDRGYRLISYGVWWIRASIQDYILKNWSMVRLGTTQRQRKLFNKLLSSRKRAEALRLYGANWKEEMAKGCGGNESDLQDMESRMRLRDCSTDARRADREDGPTLLETATAGESSAEDVAGARNLAAVRNRAILGAIQGLSDREQVVVQQRFLGEDKITLQELGKRFGVSKERVRQLEKRALLKLRRTLSPLAAELVPAA